MRFRSYTGRTLVAHRSVILPHTPYMSMTVKHPHVVGSHRRLRRPMWGSLCDQPTFHLQNVPTHIAAHFCGRLQAAPPPSRIAWPVN